MAFSLFGEDEGEDLREVALGLLERQRMDELHKHLVQENEFMRSLNAEMKTELETLKL